MAGNYQRGDLIDFIVQINQESTELSIKNHTLDIESITHDVTGTQHGGATARIGGKVDARGTVNAAFDLDNPIYNRPPDINVNSTGVALFGVGEDGTGIQVPFIVKRVHYEASVETEVRYSFDIELNVLAGELVYGTKF